MMDPTSTGAPRSSAGARAERPADALLRRAGARLAGRGELLLEASLRVTPGAIADRGRICIWLSGQVARSIDELDGLLVDLDAPAVVREALRAPEGAPHRRGVAIAPGPEGAPPRYRLYLHDRAPITQADRYRALRWSEREAVTTSRYTFHYFPETADGLRPEALLDGLHGGRPAPLLADERLRRSSGFWLREDEGRRSAVDLAYPWTPPGRALPGLAGLLESLEIAEADARRILDLHLRHLSIALDGPRPALTFYASAPLRSGWPADEAEARALVERESERVHVAVERRHARMPTLPASDRESALDPFYGGSIDRWRAVLGEGMHYHAGIFDDGVDDPDDATMDEALRRAVRELYPFLPAGGRIYDVGCGWGGPLAMIARDLGARVLGLTVSRGQYRHIAGLGLPVRLGDAERTLPPGHFECALLLESLSHIHDKGRLLRTLRAHADALVMRVNCQDAAPPAAVFGGSMQVVSSIELRAQIEGAGWRIEHWRDRRPEALASVAGWRRRLAAIPTTDDPHLEVLRRWCDRIARYPAEWGRNNPLIEVVAR